MKEIPLGKSGQVALIDDEDYERVSQYPWSLNSKGYANATIYTGVQPKNPPTAQVSIGRPYR